MGAPGSWGHFQFLVLFVARTHSRHKLFVYGDEKSSVFIPFILFIGNPYLGTFPPDCFIHPGFLRKYYIRGSVPTPSEESGTRQARPGCESISELLLQVLEGGGFPRSRLLPLIPQKVLLVSRNRSECFVGHADTAKGASRAFCVPAGKKRKQTHSSEGAGGPPCLEEPSYTRALITRGTPGWLLEAALTRHQRTRRREQSWRNGERQMKGAALLTATQRATPMFPVCGEPLILVEPDALSKCYHT